MNGQQQYQLQEGEKQTAVMVYTEDRLVWGIVITMEAIRVSTWLRTPAIPQYMTILDANVIRFAGKEATRPQNFSEIYIPSSKIIAFHIKPPQKDPLDYDPNEPMRKMEPASALVGAFQFNGYVRMSTQTNLTRYLDVMKETFTAMYDIEIIQPNLSAMGVVRTPYALLRGDDVWFSPRTT
jgi:hypothetical protein